MTSDFSLLRRHMVDSQLRTTSVSALDVLEAFLSVPREEFVPARKRDLAYIDEDVEVSAGRYLMEPSPLARLVQLAGVRPSDVVLDVGCATGYSAAILSRLASSVIAVEPDEDLAARAGDTLAELGYDNVVVLNRPLREGCAQEAPYDVILIDGAVDEVPQALSDQLRDGGRLVAVEGTGNAGVAKVFVRDGDVVSGRRAFNCSVRMLPGFEPKTQFQF
ncbi:MAG: protein-L-isoaspartate O-methyltransferase [Phyllobacteriaceae bacterium]|nr:protein-L-isoaspartate O-methyltransferase [Phyllobacteriaceae bacterium]MBA89640.1 protein-L-isoaspartate O-methyltransferase [Phyllobacteriaceae bacterium]